jgi:hypothetical protein
LNRSQNFFLTVREEKEYNGFLALEDIPGFEGPEKKIELDFLVSAEFPEGLRRISVDDWKIVLAEINCSILSQISSASCDAYILSESSLFVFPHKVIIKTCGQITLLKCIPLLLEYGKRVLAIESRMSFTRRNLLFPDQQLSPHTSFDEEVRLVLFGLFRLFLFLLELFNLLSGFLFETTFSNWRCLRFWT